MAKAAKPSRSASAQPSRTRDVSNTGTDGQGGRFGEFGATGLKQYSGYVREEWLRDLIGRKGILIYKEMRDNDPIIGAIFFAIEMLLRGVSFHVEAADADSQEAADFVESCIGDMEGTWAGFLAEVMQFLLFGWDVHEIVYKMRKGDSDNPVFNSAYDDGMIGWRKFAHRGQETLLHWIFNEAGDATHLVQLLPTGGPLLQVPLDKCLHFRTTPYKNNPEGRSIIRNAYTSYYFKKRVQEIEVVGVERDLTGLTVVNVPAEWMKPGASEPDKAALRMAQQLARDTFRNQQEGLVIPTIRNIKDPTLLELTVTLLGSGGRRQFPTNDIISRYDQRIAMTVLADFITLGQGSGGGGKSGSYAQSKSKTDIFSVANISFLDLITAEINRKAIPDLLKLNGFKNAKVTLAHGDIQRRDLQELGTYLMDAASAGLLTPDANLEAHVREEGGLPPLDPAAAYPEPDVHDQSGLDTGAGENGDQSGQKPSGGGGGKKPGSKPAPNNQAPPPAPKPPQRPAPTIGRLQQGQQRAGLPGKPVKKFR